MKLDEQQADEAVQWVKKLEEATGGRAALMLFFPTHAVTISEFDARELLACVCLWVASRLVQVAKVVTPDEDFDA